MPTSVFNVDDLTHLSYMRSKIWANYFDKILQSEEGKEIHLADMEQEFENDKESDSNEDYASVEDKNFSDKEIEHEVLNNITSCGRMKLLFNKSGRFPEVSIQDDGSDIEDKQLLVDLVNQTMPIVSEHNRQMKESGLEQILNTFDSQKIEEKVGNWLKNNSMVKENHNDPHDSTALLSKWGGSVPGKTMDPETDMDSLHSGETARYIRSSRPRGIKSVSSSTMLIKTYCMVESKREKLREKYGCHQEFYESHLKAIKGRRMMKMGNSRSYHLDEPTPRGVQRRKVLRRKRHSNSDNRGQSYSSDSDSDCNKSNRPKRINLYQKCCTPSTLTKHRAQHNNYHCQLPHVRCNQRLVKRIENSFSSTSSNTSSDSKYRKSKRRLNNNSNFYLDPRPSKRESDCNCYNSLKLCAKYKHLTDTSTEEWFIENCSPKTSSKRNKKLSNAKVNYSGISTKKSEGKKEKNSFNAKQKLDGEDRTRMVSSNKSDVKKSKKHSNYESDGNSKRDELSIETRNKSVPKKQQKYEKATPTTSLEEIIPIKNSSANLHKLKRAQKRQKPALRTNSSKNAERSTQELSKIFIKDSKSSTLRNDSLANDFVYSEASTIFADDPAVCNSTAISKSNNIARKRQFTTDHAAEKPMKEVLVDKIPKKKKIPRTSPVSSTSMLLSNENVNSPNISKCCLSHHSSEENECAIVSSTTAFDNESLQKVAAKNKKGILIYAPRGPPNGNFFDVTLEHLSSIIGEAAARNFFKYYVGRRRFNSKSKIYFKPPATEYSDTNSDDDAVGILNKYGVLYESFSHNGNDK
uniref:Uncharacterized protein n=1 Tax=Glossina brevipalpis TaxID=37001 RepID=A0A1A9X3Y5_9MUSC